MRRALQPEWHLYITMKIVAVLLVLTASGMFNNVSLTFAASQRVHTSYARVRGVSVPRALGHVVGGVPKDKLLQLSIDLSIRNKSGLDALLAAQANPASPLYHHYLTPQEFKTIFGPTQDTVNSVIAYLKSQSFTVDSVSANNVTIKVTGSVGKVENSFQIALNNYAMNNRVVFAPTLDPAVPDAVAPAIQNIVGLDNVAVYQPRYVLPPKLQNKLSPHVGTGPNGGYTPSELRTAYDVNPLINTGANGAGQTVAIFELDGYNPSDINTYLNNYNLGPAKYSNVLVDGASNIAGSGTVEVALDMEIVSALAPAAKQMIYIGPNSTLGVNDLYSKIVNDNSVKVTSTSWGQCEAASGQAELSTLDTIFKQGAAQGQSFFAASGNSGAYDCGDSSLAVDSPADQPYVVGVGGTTLLTGSGGAYSSESAWTTVGGSRNGGGGGGISTSFSQPTYQHGPNLTSSFRTVPDVSADADPATGYSIYCTGNADLCNGWLVIGGTSAAAPLWAAIATDTNQYLISQNKPPLGNVNAALYTLYNTPQPNVAYHDVTTGTNLYYNAGPGYDLATGIGSPDAWNFARDLAGTSGTPQPIPTPTTTPQPIPTPTPTPPVAFTTQLLSNGGFESGNASWLQRSGRRYNLIDRMNPHSGAFDADLCGYANCNDDLYQTVNVPATTTKAVLSYWIYVGNRSSSSSCQSSLSITLRTKNGVPIAHAPMVCNTDAHGWTHYIIDLSSVLANLKGQSIQVHFSAMASNWSAANFYVDDVAFSVTGS